MKLHRFSLLLLSITFQQIWVSEYLVFVYVIYSQPTSRVNDIFEIWMEFWNLHVSFEIANDISEFS